MELTLNLVWLTLVAAMISLWLLRAPRRGHSLRLQWAALAMLALILFPVVSLTDDLQTAQNVVEDESYVRRCTAAQDHDSAPHLDLLHTAAMVEEVFSLLPLRQTLGTATASLAPCTPARVLLPSLANRPPPTA